MSKFAGYVNKLDEAITAFLDAWENKPAVTRSEHLMYISLTRAIMISIDGALDSFEGSPEMNELAVAHLEATAMLMVDIQERLMLQLSKVQELH